MCGTDKWPVVQCFGKCVLSITITTVYYGKQNEHIVKIFKFHAVYRRDWCGGDYIMITRVVLA